MLKFKDYEVYMEKQSFQLEQDIPNNPIWSWYQTAD